eukprot:10701858-Prorocentrum_lima.AAC.1
MMARSPDIVGTRIHQKNLCGTAPPFSGVSQLARRIKDWPSAMGWHMAYTKEDHDTQGMQGQ